MPCLATTLAFYSTKMTHDSGSTEDREGYIITPVYMRLMVRTPHYYVTRLITSMPRRIGSVIDVLGTHTSYKHPELAKVLKQEIGKCRSVWYYVYLWQKHLYQKHAILWEQCRHIKPSCVKIWLKSTHYSNLYEFLLLIVQNFCP